MFGLSPTRAHIPFSASHPEAASLTGRICPRKRCSPCSHLLLPLVQQQDEEDSSACEGSQQTSVKVHPEPYSTRHCNLRVQQVTFTGLIPPLFSKERQIAFPSIPQVASKRRHGEQGELLQDTQI